MRKAFYIALLLHFLRKLLGKVMESPGEPPADFPRFSPGEPVRLDVLLTVSAGSIPGVGVEIYPGVEKFPPGTTRAHAWAALCRLAAMDTEDIFGEGSTVKEMKVAVSRGTLDQRNWNRFRSRYGIRPWGRIHNIILDAGFDRKIHAKPM